MNLEKYIHVYSNTIPFELCDQILNEYSTEDWKPGTVNNYNREKSRKCKVVLLSHEDTIQKNFHVRKNIDDNLYKIVHQSLDKYIKKCNAHGYVDVKCDSGYNLIKYDIGDYVTEHVDTYSGEHRTFSCSMILNDEYEGGELAFFECKYKLKTKKGDVVIFPSSFTYPHQVLPVTSGTRYSIITWIR